MVFPLSFCQCVKMMSCSGKRSGDNSFCQVKLPGKSGYYAGHLFFSITVLRTSSRMELCGHMATDPGHDFGSFQMSVLSQHFTQRVDINRSMTLISPRKVAYRRKKIHSVEKEIKTVIRVMQVSL